MAYQPFQSAVHSFQVLEEWKENQQQLLNEMKNSKFDFELTGSRYFASLTTTNKSKDKINLLTDYDFFIKYSDEVQTYLCGKGFRSIRDSVYKEDLNCVRVYSHLDLNIQVQLVEDVEKKRRIQKVLSDIGDDFIDLDKESRKLIWQSFSNNRLNIDEHLNKKRNELNNLAQELAKERLNIRRLQRVCDDLNI